MPSPSFLRGMSNSTLTPLLAVLGPPFLPMFQLRTLTAVSRAILLRGTLRDEFRATFIADPCSPTFLIQKVERSLKVARAFIDKSPFAPIQPPIGRHRHDLMPVRILVGFHVCKIRGWFQSEENAQDRFGLSSFPKSVHPLGIV